MEDEPRRNGCLVGLATLGLVAIAAFAVSLFVEKGGAIEGGALLGEVFRRTEMPFGLDEVEAWELAGGERLVRYARPEEATAGAGEPPPAAAAAAPPPEEPRPPEAAPEFGAAILRDAGPDGPPPEEVIVALYPGGGPVRDLFAAPVPDDLSESIEEWIEDPSHDWSAVVETDDLRFGRWICGMVRVRAFREGGGFRESIRVNLSAPGRSAVLFAQWPPNERASRERVVELLEAFELREPELPELLEPGS